MTEEIKDFRFRDNTRAPFETEVRLRFDRFGGTVSAFSADISMEGMFVKTREPKPIGTLVQFEFSVGEQDLIQGLGDVVWIRLKKSASGKPSGMGIQFRYVDPQSRDLIYRIVSRYLEERKAAGAGGTGTTGDAEASPFGLGTTPEVTAGAGEEALPSIDELVLEPPASTQSRPPPAAAAPPSVPAPGGPSVEVPPIEIPDLEPPPPASGEPPLQQAPPPAAPPAPLAPQQPTAPPSSSPGGAVESPAPPAESPPGEPEPVFDFQPQVELPEEEPTAHGATVSPLSRPPVSPEASAFEAVFGSATDEAEQQAHGGSPFKPPTASSSVPSSVPSSVSSSASSRPRGSRLGLWLVLLLVVGAAAAGWIYRDKLPGLLERAREAVGLGSTEQGADEGPAPSPPAGSPATVAAGSERPGGETGAQAPEPLDGAAEAGSAAGDQVPSPAGDGGAPETTAGESDPTATSAPASPEVAQRDPPAVPVTPPTRLRQIVARDGADSSSIVLTADQPLTADSFSTLKLESPARFVVKLLGLEQLPGRAPASTRLLGMRSGIHGPEGSRELHLVFDLAREDLRASARLREDGTIEVRLQDG